jgi:hypothetical protein
MLRIATGPTVQLGIGGRQISTINASIATSIRASPHALPLPRMLERIEAELSTAAEPAEEQWLRQRAELIRCLLAPRQSPI